MWFQCGLYWKFCDFRTAYSLFMVSSMWLLCGVETIGVGKRKKRGKKRKKKKKKEKSAKRKKKKEKAQKEKGKKNLKKH